MKHTPGPWEVDKETGEIIARESVLGIIYGADDFPCCEEDIDEECRANAYLIAAAPDLLEALEDCCTRMERCRSILQDPRCGGNPESNWGMLDTQKARAAISKAEGGNDGK